jgi:ABC-type xylose transport system permease subunit
MNPAFQCLAVYVVAFLIFLIAFAFIARRAPMGREVPGVGFVYTDEHGNPLPAQKPRVKIEDAELKRHLA